MTTAINRDGDSLLADIAAAETAVTDGSAYHPDPAVVVESIIETRITGYNSYYPNSQMARLLGGYEAVPLWRRVMRVVTRSGRAKGW